MRMTIISLAAVAVLMASTAAGGHAAGTAPHMLAPSVATQEDAPRPVDDNDDTRVEVQLIVLGVAAAIVVGVGLAGYALRWKLGRIPGPPEQPAPH